MHHIPRRWRRVLAAGIAWGALGSVPLRADPAIFHATESARPGDVIGCQGAGFGASPTVLIATVDATGNPGATTALAPQSASDAFVAATVPAAYGAGLWQVQVRDGSGNLSTPVFVNRARITSMEFPEIDPGRQFRLFGRNLVATGGTPSVRFVDNANPAISIAGTVAAGGDAYVVAVQAPAGPSGVLPGHIYTVHYSNGQGGSAGDAFAPGLLPNPPSLVEQAPGLPVIASGIDPYGLNVPWGSAFAGVAATTYEATAYGAMGNGVHDDEPAIQAAIDAAHAHPGGAVVHLPAGNYRLVTRPTGNGTFLTLRGNVVLKGDGAGSTTLTCVLPASISGTAGMIQAAAGSSVLGMVDLTVRRDAAVNFDLTPANYPMFCTNDTPPRDTSKLFLLRVTFDGTQWAQGGVKLVADAGAGRFLMACCTVENLRRDARALTTKDFGNAPNTASFVTVRGCSFPNYNVCPLLGGDQVLYEDNDLVFDGTYYNGLLALGQAFPDSGVQNRLSIAGPNVIVLNSTFRHMGDPFVNQNDGENILAEEHATNPDQGLVTGHDATSLDDSTKAWTPHAYAGYAVVLADGTGKGQWRLVTDNTATTLAVSPAWTVAPASDSRYYVFQWNVPHLLVKGNTVTGQDHVFESASGGYDDAIVQNTATDSKDIEIRSVAGIPGGVPDQLLGVSMEILVADNTLTAATAERPSMISFNATYDDAARLGTGAFLVEARRNTVTSLGTEAFRAVDILRQGPFAQWHPSAGAAPLAMEGILFDGNTAHDAATGYGWLPGYDGWVVAASTETGIFRHSYDLTRGDGTLAGGATLGTGALSLDGTGSADLRPLVFPTAMTIEGKFRTSSANGAILGNRKYVGSLSVSLNSTGQLKVWDNGFTSGSIATSGHYNDGMWHQFAWTSDGTEEKVYVDGALQASNPSDSRTASAGEGTMSLDASSSPFDGELGEIRVWSGVRSGDELAAFQDTRLAGDEPGLLQYWRLADGAGIVALNGVLSGDLAPGLVGYWRCDEGDGTALADSSPGGHPATLSRVVTGTTWADGAYGPAIRLTGASDYASVPDTASLDMTSALTVHARIYADSFSPSWNLNWRGILSKGNPGAAPFSGWEFGTYSPSTTSSSPGVGIYFRRGAGVTDITCTGTANLNAGQWYAVDATWDSATGTVAVYVDGQLQATTSNPRVLPAVAAPLYLGRRATEGPFLGVLDDLKIYNRALSAQEIAELSTP